MYDKLFNKQELKFICLNATIDSLDSILNPELLELRGSAPDSAVYFHQKTQQKYFYILLIDFISEKRYGPIFKEKLTFLDIISKIYKNPEFNINDSVSELKRAINIFVSWLDKEITVNTWLPTIDKEYDLKLKRKEFIYICANISKHDSTSLTSVPKKLIKIFKKNEIDISFHDSLLVLEEFYERFHDDIMIYHASNIAEMLNDIRWSIQQHLLPEFNQSYTKDMSDSRGQAYSYAYPKNINDKFAKSCYWRLMNSIRKGPNFRKFTSTKWLKLRY